MARGHGPAPEALDSVAYIRFGFRSIKDFTEAKDSRKLPPSEPLSARP